MQDDAPQINIRENGPLVVKNVRSFRLPDGSEAEEKAIRVLCRCGQSKNKPFCDGSHNDSGFDGSASDVSHRDRVYPYEGAQVAVYYNKLLCSHAGECARLAPDVFDPAKKPWVQPDNGEVDLIKQVVATCPSGALRLSAPGQSATALTQDDVTVSVDRHGPIRVTNVPIGAETWAEGQSEKKYVLCRCGKSGNKPFCDGTHHDIGWKDDR